MSKRFDKYMEKATDATLVEADWEMIMTCVDFVRSGEVPAKHALVSVRKRIQTDNPHVSHHALLLLEALVKNCGEKFHREIATKEFMEDMKHTAAESSEKVKEKILELIQCWAHAFRDKPEYKIVKDTHALMKLEGFSFPAFREADAMFTAEVAPEWVDADKCYRCKVSFSLLNRKHHCRNCGQIFCDKCSSRYIALPHIGIEKDVRVCETCFDKFMRKSVPAPIVTPKTEHSKTADSTTPGSATQPAENKPEGLSREEEELQLALALSQSEAEERERQRQRHIVQSYNGADNKSTSNNNLGYKGVMDNSPGPVNNSGEPDNELARYLNRDYWEQRRVEQKTGILRQSPTPSAPFSEIEHSSMQNMGNSDEHLSNAAVPNGVKSDTDFMPFATNLRSTIDIFINRIRSDQSRGRSILGDGNLQTTFMTLTDMHSQLLKYLNELDDRRGYFESLQDKLAQIQDAREAIEALREEHQQRRHAEILEMQRQRQIQMMAKLGTMRQKKHEMLEQQRLLALQRMVEERRQMEMRKQLQQQAAMVSYGVVPGSGPPGMMPQGQNPVGMYGPQVSMQQMYHGPSEPHAVPNPYDMQQMAASLPQSNMPQQPQFAPQPSFNGYSGQPPTQMNSVPVTAYQQQHQQLPQQQQPPPPQGQQQQQQHPPQPVMQTGLPTAASQPQIPVGYYGQPTSMAPMPQTFYAASTAPQTAGYVVPGGQPQQPMVFSGPVSGYPTANQQQPFPIYVPAGVGAQPHSMGAYHPGQPNMPHVQQPVEEAQLISFD